MSQSDEEPLAHSTGASASHRAVSCLSNSITYSRAAYSAPPCYCTCDGQPRCPRGWLRRSCASTTLLCLGGARRGHTGRRASAAANWTGRTVNYMKERICSLMNLS
ncbi:hypothetical protein NDU88_000662 [Pleurodeles waltl]|uniref:Uncharacterized protein n=1 Tax=Pleurodeles waltl TaxID=8319 RepID=A0AAV7P8W4_PLEWA|nr:hypothetical protein NDU88_000662 [Pleurodeles waltl]